MELKAGYKQTEVGVIPEDWEVQPLSAVLEFRNGANADKSAYGFGVPFINVLEVITHSHLNVNLIPGRVSLSDSATQSYAVRRGDILFNRTSETQEEVGLTSVYQDDAPVIFGGFVIRGRPKHGANYVDPQWSGYGFRCPAVRSQIVARGQGAIRANVGQSDLSKVYIPLPPIAEQRAIAAALSDVDALLNGLDKLIAKKRDIKQAAMQELLTGKRRLPGFSGKWEEKRLGDLGSWKGGMTPSMSNPLFWGGGTIPWISSGDVKSIQLLATGSYITEFAASQGATVMIPANSIVLVVRSGILRKYLPVATNSIPMAVNQDIKALVPLKGVDVRFLLHSLIGKGDRILASCLKSGTTVESIEFGWLKAFTIPIPSLDEQVAIADTLSAMDAELAALEERREKTHLLKQGMMQELLTGRVRLV